MNIEDSTYTCQLCKRTLSTEDERPFTIGFDSLTPITLCPNCAETVSADLEDYLLEARVRRIWSRQN